MVEKLFFLGDRYAAIQGYQRHSLNSLENPLMRLIAASFCAAYKVILKAFWKMRGFILLTGSVMMIRLDALRSVGVFEASLVEDLELAYRLLLRDYKIAYDDTLYAEGECPSAFRKFLKQQKRWVEGTIYEFRRYARELLISSKLGMIEKITLVFHALQFAMPLVIVIANEQSKLPSNARW